MVSITEFISSYVIIMVVISLLVGIPLYYFDVYNRLVHNKFKTKKEVQIALIPFGRYFYKVITDYKNLES